MSIEKKLIENALTIPDEGIMRLAVKWDWPDSEAHKKSLRQALLAIPQAKRDKLMELCDAHGTSSCLALRDSLRDMKEKSHWRVSYTRRGWEPPRPFGKTKVVVCAPTKAEAIEMVDASPGYPVTAAKTSEDVTFTHSCHCDKTS